MSRLRSLVWKPLCPCGERLRSRRSGMFALLSDGTNLCAYLGGNSFRYLSITGLFQITAFYASMASSYPVTPTTTMSSFLTRTRLRHFSSKSVSSGYRPDSTRPLPSPSLSPIRYRKTSFDTFVFSDRTNRISPS